MNDLEAMKRSISATLDEIALGERGFKEQHGVAIADVDEWQQLKDIVARIERRLGSQLAERATNPRAKLDEVSR